MYYVCMYECITVYKPYRHYPCIDSTTMLSIQQTRSDITSQQVALLNSLATSKLYTIQLT